MPTGHYVNVRKCYDCNLTSDGCRSRQSAYRMCVNIRSGRNNISLLPRVGVYPCRVTSGNE